MSNDMKAMAVSDTLLVKTGDAMLSGDFETFRKCFFLPQQVETFDGSRWLLETSDVRDIFDSVRQNFADRGVTDMVRRCIAAQFTGPDTIEATHETRILVGTRIDSGPNPCFSILQRIDGEWQVSHSQYAVADDAGYSQALVNPDVHKALLRA